MEKTTLGTAIITYNESGKVSVASFIPTLKINLTPDLYDQLLEVNGTTQEGLQQNADLILGAWFAKINEVELAPRERYEVKSKVIECEKYPDGTIKSCALEYYFQERSELLN